MVPSPKAVIPDTDVERPHDVRHHAEKIWDNFYGPMMRLAGFNVLKKWLIPDPYAFRSTVPAFLVKTEFGMIELSARKRVFQVDWEDTQLRALKVTNDDVTCQSTYVHAYTEEALFIYLKSLLACLKVVTHRGFENHLEDSLVMVFKLYHMDRMTIKEISKLLGLSESVVQRRLDEATSGILLLVPG